MGKEQLLISIAMAIRAGLAVNQGEKYNDTDLASEACNGARALYNEMKSRGWVRPDED